MVYKLRHVICKFYAAYFFIWGNGGANWRREHALWCMEQDAEWTLVGSKSKSKKSFADVVRSPVDSQNLSFKPPVRKSAFVRLQYPLDYHLNYLSSPSPAHNHASNFSRPFPNHALIPGKPRQMRVLRWVPRFQNSKDT
jgi:hypothetical protein